MKRSRKDEDVAGPSHANEYTKQKSESSKDEESVFVSPIAKPMACHKLRKKVCKLIKAGVTAEGKTNVKNGLRAVQTSLRRNERGIVIFAGDVSPIEIMCHLPAVCEEMNIPYVYVPSRQILGQAVGVARGSLMVLVKKHEDYNTLYDEVAAIIATLPPPY